MALRLAGETPGVVQGLDNSGWPQLASPGTVDLREAFLGRLRTGVYYVNYPFWLRDGYGSNALTANTLYGSPFWVPRKAAIDRIAVNVVTGTGVAGDKARLGLYRNGTNLQPGSLFADAGEVAVDTAGVKSIAVSWSVAGGLWWLAILANAAPAIMGTTSERIPIVGWENNLATNNAGWSSTQTYGALPDPFPLATLGTREALFGLALRFASFD